MSGLPTADAGGMPVGETLTGPGAIVGSPTTATDWILGGTTATDPVGTTAGLPTETDGAIPSGATVCNGPRTPGAPTPLSAGMLPITSINTTPGPATGTPTVAVDGMLLGLRKSSAHQPAATFTG